MARTDSADDRPQDEVVTRASGTYLRMGAAALVVVVLDQITKSLAVDRLGDGRVIEVIDGAVSLRLTLNSGGAFGLGQGFPLFFLAATILVIALILLWVRNLDDRTLAMPLGMVLGGGVGNAMDRLFRDTGGRVVDFVDLHVWPVFNVADASITVGVVAILWVTVVAGRSRTD